LGDLIDRGPDSAGVVERLRTYRPEVAQTVFLSGNHEEIMLRAIEGEHGMLADWLKYGGAECLTSYGVNLERLRRLGPARAVEYLKSEIPSTHRDFLSGFSDTFRFGDYIFVHAGIRPGIPLNEQEPADLRWIRQPFLSDAKNHGFVVVHGHTIVQAVEERTNRIAIDTGAYQSGILTALAIEEGRRWYLDTHEPGPGAAEPRLR
jgi:serine/threonine protein phosphatase 1